MVPRTPAVPWLLAVLLAACSAPKRDLPPPAASTTADNRVAGSSAAPAPAESPAPALEPQPSQEIVIDSVTPTNPVIVKGHARTFENAVSLRVRDARGALITEVHTTSVGDAGHHNPFEVQLWLVRDPGPSIAVDAFEYSAKDGSMRSLTSKSIGYPPERIRATLMFPATDCTDIRPFIRVIPKTVSMARLLLEALIAGPTPEEKAAGATSPFPSGSAVRSVVLREGVLTVDFNERLQNVGGSCAATAIRESVTRTLKTLPSVKQIVITAAGSENIALQP